MPSLLPPEALSDVQIVFAAGPKLSARAVFGGTGGLAPCSDQSTFATGLSCLCPNVVKKKAVLGVLPSGIPQSPRAPFQSFRSRADLSPDRTHASASSSCRAARIGTLELRTRSRTRNRPANRNYLTMKNITLGAEAAPARRTLSAFGQRSRQFYLFR